MLQDLLPFHLPGALIQSDVKCIIEIIVCQSDMI